ncbi:MAG: nuclear transport factor 2 family protein [Aureispira sp.]
MMQDTMTTFQTLFEAFSTGNVDKILSLYTNKSVIVNANNTYRGLEEIKTYFEFTMGQMSQEGLAFQPGITKFEGNVAYSTWSADTPDKNHLEACETYYIQDSKILAHTIALVVQAQ